MHVYCLRWPGTQQKISQKVLIFYADELFSDGQDKISCVFNFTTLSHWQNSQKSCVNKKYVFCSRLAGTSGHPDDRLAEQHLNTCNTLSLPATGWDCTTYHGLKQCWGHAAPPATCGRKHVLEHQWDWADKTSRTAASWRAGQTTVGDLQCPQAGTSTRKQPISVTTTVMTYSHTMRINISIALHGNPTQSYEASPAITHSGNLPTDTGKHPHLNPSQAGQYSIYFPRGIESWVDLGGWLCTTFTHPSTNRAQHKATTSIVNYYANPSPHKVNNSEVF